jgi:hypothetical protein
MRTKREIGKKFDAVEFMRKKREEISKEIEGMSPQQEIEYFKMKASQLRGQKP